MKSRRNPAQRYLKKASVDSSEEMFTAIADVYMKYPDDSGEYISLLRDALNKAIEAGSISAEMYLSIDPRFR